VTAAFHAIAEGHDPVLVVVTPGWPVEAFLPLARALAADGHRVGLLELPCAGQGPAALAAEITAARDTVPGHVTVVAHGVGAALALLARPDDADYALLSPLLGARPLAAVAALPDGGAAADLGVPIPFGDTTVQRVLFGEVSLGCTPGPLLDAVQAWSLAGVVPVDLAAIDAAVWLGVSLGDAFANVEAVVPASRALPRHTVARMGIDSLDPRDYDHVGMLVEPRPIRRLVRAVRGP
jgi:hypothetical protein